MANRVLWLKQGGYRGCSSLGMGPLFFIFYYDEEKRKAKEMDKF
jgi:hypothetical protein